MTLAALDITLPADDPTTPMMRQYLDLKEAHQDALLFYRMGDFYELFFEDAIKAAEALDIALTRRGKHQGQDIPMCGVPHHSSEVYLSKLIRQGFKVAICEQMENPAEAKKRGYKAVVKRDVVRIITPGTLTEENILEAKQHNYLLALKPQKQTTGVAWVDISTGQLKTQQLSTALLGNLLSQLDPKEILLPDQSATDPTFLALTKIWSLRFTPQPASKFNLKNTEKNLLNLFAIQTLDAFGPFSEEEVAACGALVAYLELTQKGHIPRLSAPQRVLNTAFLDIDAATRRNLELTQTLSGQRKGSLLATLDRTLTCGGGRLLFDHITSPLCDPKQIDERLDRVGYFVDTPTLRTHLRDHLKATPDLRRALCRLVVDRGRPRDLGAVRDALSQSAKIRDLFDSTFASLPLPVKGLIDGLGCHDSLIDTLERALSPTLPALMREGGIIAQGYAPELDHLRTLRDESHHHILQLQGRYCQQSGVQGLKIKHNNVLGFFIEVTPLHAPKLTEPFIHRQTLANAVRFTTTELSELEQKINNAADQALAIEQEVIQNLINQICTQATPIESTCAALDHLDVSSSLADLAVDQSYARPRVDISLDFSIKGGRHPVVESLHKTSPFVANDCTLVPKESNLWLITGPNMAGKSTFLRQNALIALMAQMGSFVPAQSAHIGIIDKLYSRVGAADDLAQGRSTFMVEMVETAAILNQATHRSFVILDEIGRGTATYDGLSIAWATIEHLHNLTQCRGLFATHYHELTTLTTDLKHLSTHCVQVKEWKGDVVFLYTIAPGSADKSYGIHVAKLAGLPESVTHRAEEILAHLEKEESKKPTQVDLPLTEPKMTKDSPIHQKLAQLDPNTLTPMEALTVLFELKKQV